MNDVLCAVCLTIFTPRNELPRFYCGEKCSKISYRIRRGNMLKRLNRKFRADVPATASDTRKRASDRS